MTEIDPMHFRNVMGQVPTTVTVITAMVDDMPIAMVIGSFVSVSLDPPLVLWNLQNNSDVYDVFARPRYFAINVLSSEQMEHSNRYAKKGEHQLAPEHFQPGKHGAPIVNDALVTFECELDATHEGGDHLIIVGRVHDMQSRPDGDPLLFYSGAYRELR